MDPISFSQANATFGPSDGKTEKEVRTVRAHRYKMDDGTPCTILCYKVTGKDIRALKKDGTIWLQVMGESFPPVSLDVVSPFEEVTPSKT